MHRATHVAEPRRALDIKSLDDEDEAVVEMVGGVTSIVSGE